MRRLVIFLKYPTPGQVKTRLASTLGAQAACEAYRICVELTVHRLQRFQQEAALWIEPPEAVEETRRWLGAEWSYAPQPDGDLGARLIAATASAFRDGAQRVVVVGTDSPWISGQEVDEAFTSLDTHDLVLGPSRDGGYYLIGLAKPMPKVFTGIAWSASIVMSQTLAIAKQLGLSVHQLHLGYDVDHQDDWQRFLDEWTQERGAR